MKNLKRKIMTSLVGTSMLLCVTPMVYATEVNTPADATVLNVETGIDKTLEIPLTLESEKDVFYFCTNINPGDTMKASVIFKNTSTEDIQISVADVINMLTEDEQAKKLLDILNLTISIDGSPIYMGTHSKVTTPVTGWITIPGGKSITMEIEIYFPKEADNTYQGANMNVKWVFEARADVPPDPEEPEEPEEPNEETKTGDELRKNYGMYILEGAAVVAIVGGIIVVKRKKEEN